MNTKETMVMMRKLTKLFSILLLNERKEFIENIKSQSMMKNMYLNSTGSLVSKKLNPNRYASTIIAKADVMSMRFHENTSQSIISIGNRSNGIIDFRDSIMKSHIHIQKNRRIDIIYIMKLML